MSKIKGTTAERELVHMFWKAGWACIRVAGSGSMRHPAPDLLAGNNIRKVAIECKSTKSKRQYLDLCEIDDLKRFSEVFGSEAWVGVRFDRLSWYFFNPEDLIRTKGNFCVSKEMAKTKGLSFEELIS